MGKLAAIQEGMSGVQKRLDDAIQLSQSRTVDIDAILEGKFGKVSSRIENALRSMADEARNAQHAEFNNMVHAAMLNVTQTLQLILNTHTQQSQSVLKSNKSLSGDIGKISNRTEVGSLASQLKTLETAISALPTQFPLPKDVDLSGLSSEIKMLRESVANIKMPKMPKTFDIKPQLKNIEDKLGNRVVEFDVIRDNFGLIEKIVVTENG